MSSPGGEEVGRVSVRVVPDSSRFRDQLRRELRNEDLNVTVPVNFEVDRDQLRRDIESIRVPTVNVPVDFDRSAFDRVMDDVREREIQIGVDSDSIRGDIERAVENAGFKAKIEADQQALRDSFRTAIRASQLKVDVDVDDARIRASAANLRNLFSGASSAIGAGLRSAFGLGQAGADALGGSIAGVNVSLGSAVSLVAKFAAGGFVAAEAGAAITAAWGAVSTAIAAVPAAIGLIGAPIAAVMLGMDGIKKAAQTLKPEFDKLKASVSANFQQGLTPIFNQLRGSLTALTAPINAVADSLITLAQQTANWITHGPGLQQIQTIFTNVANVIKTIDLIPLLDGFTRLAGNQAALQAIAGFIDEIGQSIQAIANNPALNEAFAGLEGVLRSLTSAFTDLINNGIKAFASAAPGVQSALDGIAGFFNRFDWTALGKAVGDSLRGIGDALKNIPQSTIDAIVKSFQELGAVLSGPQVAGAIRVIADQLPGLVSGLATAIDGLADLVVKVQGIGDLFGALVSGDAARIEAAFNNLFKDTPPTVEERLRATGEAIKTGGAGMASAAGSAAQGANTAFTTPLQPLPGQVGTIIGGVPPAMTGPLQGLPGLLGALATPVVPAFVGPIAPMPQQAGAAVAPTAPAVTAPLQRVPGEVGAIAGQIPGQFMGPIAPLPGQAQGAGQRIVAGFGSGIAGLSPSLQQELGLLPPVATTGLGEVGTAVNTGVAGIATGVPAELVPLQTAFTTGFAAITSQIPTTFTTPFQTALTTAFTTINSQIPTLFTAPFQTALTTAFTTINAQIPTLFTTPFQTALTTAFTTVTAQIPTLFTTPFQTALTTAFTTINSQIPTLFTTPFQTALTTGFTTIFAAFPTIFTLPFQTAITTAITTLTAAFPTIFTTPFQTALTTAFTTIFTTNWATIFTTPFQTALTTSMTTITAALPTTFEPLKTAFTTAFTEIVALIPTNFETPAVEAFNTAFTNINTAVTTGMTNVTTEVRTGVDNVITELDRLPPAGTTTGDNLITSMADAILAGRSRLVNAIAQVIQAAITAATAMLQIGSPSKVSGGWGDATIAGFVNHLLAGKSAAVGAMQDVMAAVVAAGQAYDLTAVLPDIGRGGLGSLSAQISAEGATQKASPPPVNVFIGDEPFRGQIRAEIGSYDGRLRGALAVRGGR